MTTKKSIPAPHVEEETRPYWDGLREGKLLVKYCRTCEAAHHYPRSICPHCGSDDTYYKESDGTGKIYSYSVFRVVPEPYAIAYVTIAGAGISMMTNIVNCDLDSLAIGQEVKLCVVDTEGDGPPVPMFEPA